MFRIVNALSEYFVEENVKTKTVQWCSGSMLLCSAGKDVMKGIGGYFSDSGDDATSKRGPCGKNAEEDLLWSPRIHSNLSCFNRNINSNSIFLH